ncbi:MAG: hypothetical protein HY918_01140, partial [Candidatus Doudnabacteria bacterium]|nr:hypothetical protein [Candidatus Doudnabacteria bacterium]
GKDDVQYGPGDGTVPIISASNIGGTQNFYVLNKESIHGAMLTTEGVREKIVSLIAGTTYNSNSIVTTNPALCVFKGKKVEVHSPVDLHIYDENGNHVGINSQGGFDYEMPEVQYDEIGHSKYAFLPDDEHSYSLRLVATDDGVFNFYSSSVEGSETKSISYYSDITISSSSVAQIVLNSQNNQAINFLTDNRVFFPSSILNLEQSKDSVFPISTSTIIGLFGEPGFYRSNATITLSALDPIIDGKTEEASGVLKTQYSLDGGEYLTYSTTSPIVITSEGEHSVKFYSTDRAGNNEPEQEINFVIDKTPPELIIAFNPFIKDLEFIATDTLPSIVTTTSTQPKFKWPKIPAIKFKDSDNIIAATDAAGNTIQLELKDKNRKSLMSAEIKSIKYNGQAANISKNKLAFVWQYNKNGNLSYLLQNAQSKVGFNILAVYNGSKTTLAGKDGKGFINKTLIGLNVLTLSTIKGDLNWSIKSVSLPPPIVRRR